MRSDDYKSEIEGVIKELSKFSDNVVTLNSPVDLDLIAKFEQKYK